MKEARRGHCAVTIDDKIYAIGGEGQYGQSLSSIECYNADKWVLCRQMLGKRFLVFISICKNQNLQKSVYVTNFGWTSLYLRILLSIAPFSSKVRRNSEGERLLDIVCVSAAVCVCPVQKRISRNCLVHKVMVMSFEFERVSYTF